MEWNDRGEEAVVKDLTLSIKCQCHVSLTKNPDNSVKIPDLSIFFPPRLLTLWITVEPKVYVSAGSTALIDGGNETVVATCIAERARPPAEVSWESNLFGQSEVQLFDEVNGTTSTQVRYLWHPTRHVQGHMLTCVVRHPALQSDFRIPYKLNVQCRCFMNNNMG